MTTYVSPMSAWEIGLLVARGRLYLRRIATIRNVSDFRKLFDVASLHLHPLTGDRQGAYAITLTGRWRLILKVERDTAVIEEVSNHYGD